MIASYTIRSIWEINPVIAWWLVSQFFLGLLVGMAVGWGMGQKWPIKDTAYWQSLDRKDE